MGPLHFSLWALLDIVMALGTHELWMLPGTRAGVTQVNHTEVMKVAYVSTDDLENHPTPGAQSENT